MEDTNLQETVKQAVKKALDSSMTDLIKIATESIKRNLDEKVEKEVEKKVKLEETPTFRRKFNENHYKHTREMDKVLDKINVALEKEDFDKAKKTVKDGKKLISKRQKLIKLADREEHGWEVVRCYQSDALASDSEDEKRLAKSRRQAFLNKKEARLSRNSGYEKQNFDSFSPSSSRTQTSRNYMCYFCGKAGHMQYSCPDKRSKSNKGQ